MFKGGKSRKRLMLFVDEVILFAKNRENNEKTSLWFKRSLNFGRIRKSRKTIII